MTAKPSPSRPGRTRPAAILLFAAAIVAAVAVLTLRQRAAHTPAADAPRSPERSASSAPSELSALLALPAEAIGAVDIARLNLLCASGLPGAEALDLAAALETLDAWAAHVQRETERHLYRVNDPRYAEHYRRSEAYFRAEMLLQVLQTDLGVKYNQGAAWDFSFADSRVAFLHGMIPPPGRGVEEMPGGTCLSMPVMYAAIGRRLGYPLALVMTDSHVFVRWDGEGHANPAWRERFNIEGAGEGFSSFPDDYYRTWPRAVGAREVELNRYLVSLTPAETFALFLAARGHCLLDNGDAAGAARCYEDAYRYDDSRACYAAWFLDAAVPSGYRPAHPALRAMIAERD